MTALALILFVGAALRLYRLPELPLGLHYDEAANGILAGELARGAKTPIFISAYTGKEVGFFYWAALWMKMLGASTLALRLAAALAGLATVAATAWAVRELLGDWPGARWAALASAGFLAASFWHIVLSRYGFRAITQPLLQALTVAALWRGLRHGDDEDRAGGEAGIGWVCGSGRTMLWFALAGFFCGLTAYTYLAARAFPVPLAFGLLGVMLVARRRRALLVRLAGFAGVAAIVLAPLAAYWLTHPGSFLNRARQVSASSWPEAWAGIRSCLGMFFLQGDPYIRFNLPYRPLMDPLTAALFVLGALLIVGYLALGLRRGRLAAGHASTGSALFLIAYLPVMLLPSALAVGEVTPSNLRAVGLLPFMYLFPAVGLWGIGSWVSRILSIQPRRPSLWQAVGLLLLLVLLTPMAVQVYFGRWASSSALYYAADGDMVDAARYLNTAGATAGRAPYVASVHYRHPTVAFLARDYPAIRWITGGRTLVVPAEGEALLLLPRSASTDLAWVRSLLPSNALVDEMDGPDGQVAVRVYRIGHELGLAPTHSLTANFGHVAQVQGYDVVVTEHPARDAEVSVWWRVLARPAQGDLSPVARLTDPWGFVWGEHSPFHYPGEQWTPGETIIDHLSIPIGLGAPPGDYRVRFSLYSAQEGAALPVLDGDGRYAGRWVELPVRLTRRTTTSSPEEASAVLSQLDVQTRLEASAGDLLLHGATLSASSARQGEPLNVTLFWWTAQAGVPDYEVVLTLGDRTLYAGRPVHATYPFFEWAAGEIVVDRYDPRLPRDMPPDEHTLILQVRDPAEAGSPALAVDLGTVDVRAIQRTFEVPSMDESLDVTLGKQVELLGYDLAADTVVAGESATLTLYWRALAEMEMDYTVFVHLVAPDGSMTGQQDAQPVSGTYPTSLWLPGEVVVDRYEVPVRADAPLGAHRLEVGMYVAETGQRLKTSEHLQDAVFLGAIPVRQP